MRRSLLCYLLLEGSSTRVQPRPPSIRMRSRVGGRFAARDEQEIEIEHNGPSSRTEEPDGRAPSEARGPASVLAVGFLGRGLLQARECGCLPPSAQQHSTFE